MGLYKYFRQLQYNVIILHQQFKNTNHHWKIILIHRMVDFLSHSINHHKLKNIK